MELEGGPYEKFELVAYGLNLLSKMVHTQIILPGCFFNFSLDQFSPLDELLDHLSQLKFDREDGMSITKHIDDFLQFCELYEIDNEDSACFLSSSPLKVRLIDGVISCHLLPSIPFTLSTWNSINPLVSITTKMFVEESTY